MSAWGAKGLRWEDPGKFHVTLRFMGEVEPDRLDAIKRAGAEAAGARSSFTLRLSEIGAFPARGAARVMWIGGESALPDYAGLAEYLERSLIAHGAVADGGPIGWAIARQSRPHVTLARVKSPEGADAIRRALRDNSFHKVDKEAVLFVYNITLIRSDLRPGGSVYTPVESFPLSAG